MLAAEDPLQANSPRNTVVLIKLPISGLLSTSLSVLGVELFRLLLYLGVYGGDYAKSSRIRTRVAQGKLLPQRVQLVGYSRRCGVAYLLRAQVGRHQRRQDSSCIASASTFARHQSRQRLKGTIVRIAVL